MTFPDSFRKLLRSFNNAVFFQKHILTKRIIEQVFEGGSVLENARHVKFGQHKDAIKRQRVEGVGLS